MIEKYDSLVNKYIDKELDSTDLEIVENLMQTNEEFKTVLSVQNYVHEKLPEMPQKKAPNGFTELIMKNILNRLNEKYRKNYLFRGVISVLTLILICTLFIFFYYLGDLAFVKSAAQSTSSYKNIFSQSITYLSHLFSTEIFRTISVLFGLLVLIGFYFNFNSHKNLKDTLDKL